MVTFGSGGADGRSEATARRADGMRLMDAKQKRGDDVLLGVVIERLGVTRWVVGESKVGC